MGRETEIYAISTCNKKDLARREAFKEAIHAPALLGYLMGYPKADKEMAILF